MTAFIAAEIQEFAGLRRHLKKEHSLDLKSRWAVSGELNGNDVVLTANGPGPKLAGRAAQAVEENRKLNALVSYGFCGALDPALAVNDIVVVQGRAVGAPWALAVCLLPKRPAGLPTPKKILSIDRVITTAQEKAELFKTGAAAVEMEAAGVGSFAQARSIPFYCIRVVTDAANEDFPIDFNRVRDSEGRFSRIKIMVQAARNPLKLVPALIALHKRANAAAHTLGDFVATCEF